MALKDRFRRAIKRNPSSSDSSTNTTPYYTPNASAPPSKPVSPIATAPQTPNPNGTSNNPPFSQSTSPPKLTLTKTRSGLSLTKTLTFRSTKTAEEKERKRIEKWEKMDELEWREPSRRAGAKKRSKAHQDILRGFELKFRGSLDVDRRKDSGRSGISPGCSRNGSIVPPEDEGLEIPRVVGRKRSSTAGVGAEPLSQEVSRNQVVESGTVSE